MRGFPNRVKFDSTLANGRRFAMSNGLVLSDWRGPLIRKTSQTEKRRQRREQKRRAAPLDKRPILYEDVVG
jgi:hypothetical protein